MDPPETLKLANQFLTHPINDRGAQQEIRGRKCGQHNLAGITFDSRSNNLCQKVFFYYLPALTQADIPVIFSIHIWLFLKDCLRKFYD